MECFETLGSCAFGSVQNAVGAPCSDSCHSCWCSLPAFGCQGLVQELPACSGVPSLLWIEMLLGHVGPEKVRACFSNSTTKMLMRVLINKKSKIVHLDTKKKKMTILINQYGLDCMKLNAFIQANQVKSWKPIYFP